MLKLPAVQDIAFVTGRFDYQVRVACRSTEDLDRTVRAIRADGGGASADRDRDRVCARRPGKSIGGASAG